jgi:ABC-type transport system involved in multi-copper enzyme maturation permease subunit
MSRTSFILGKFSALSLTFLLAIALAGISSYYYTYVLFGVMNAAYWLALNGLLLLYVLLYTAITVFFSTLTRTQYLAIGGAFGVLIVLGILSSIPGWAAYLPDGLIQNAALLMTGGSISGWSCLWVSLVIIVIVLASACLIFRKQEL